MSGTEITNKVVECRVKKDVTQEELAKAVGVSRQTIITLEKGDCTPSVCLALKIAKYFNIKVEDIFTLQEK